MISSITSIYHKMDLLSTSQQPFFFMVDFKQDKAEIFLPEELDKENISIEFPLFKTEVTQKELPFLEFQCFEESIEIYRKGFDYIQEHLHLGDTYLANYTCKTPISINYTLEELFLATQAKYKIKYKDEFVCFSPETFIEIQGDSICTYPMKGTIEACLPNAAEILREDEKEKAEHYTVVDLLRNDLSIVANHVTVREFQRIDTINTHRGKLLGMSSKIEGTLRAEYKGKIGSILRELLPAGSILGAPKPKTMEVVLKAELNERGWYTGVCGYFDGKNVDSCVLIRFIEKENEQFFFRSGGGITHQSNLEDEYEEMKKKNYVPILRKY